MNKPKLVKADGLPFRQSIMTKRVGDELDGIFLGSEEYRTVDLKNGTQALQAVSVVPQSEIWDRETLAQKLNEARAHVAKLERYLKQMDERGIK